MNELKAVFKILFSVRQHAGEALALVTHSGGAPGPAVRRTAKGAEHIVLDARPGKNMWTQHVDAAISQCRRALLNDLVGLHFVNRIRQRMRAQGKVLAHRFRQVWTICGNTAGENKSSYDGIITIGFGDRFHHSSRTGHVDLPHPLKVEYTRAHRIEDKSQVNYCDRSSFSQQKKQLAAGLFQTEVHAQEAKGMAGLRRIQINSDD